MFLTCCRFDLMHVMLDEPDDTNDENIARHIVLVHQRRERAFNVPYSMAQIQRYIRYARSIKPELTDRVGSCTGCALALPHSAMELRKTGLPSKTMASSWCCLTEAPSFLPFCILTGTQGSRLMFGLQCYLRLALGLPAGP